MTDFRQYPKVRLNQSWDIPARTVLNNAMAGKLNVVGELVLTAGSATVSYTHLTLPTIYSV